MAKGEVLKITPDGIPNEVLKIIEVPDKPVRPVQIMLFNPFEFETRGVHIMSLAPDDDETDETVDGSVETDETTKVDAGEFAACSIQSILKAARVAEQLAHGNGGVTYVTPMESHDGSMAGAASEQGGS